MQRIIYADRTQYISRDNAEETSEFLVSDRWTAYCSPHENDT